VILAGQGALLTETQYMGISAVYGFVAGLYPTEYPALPDQDDGTGCAGRPEPQGGLLGEAPMPVRYKWFSCFNG